MRPCRRLLGCRRPVLPQPVLLPELHEHLVGEAAAVVLLERKDVDPLGLSLIDVTRGDVGRGCGALPDVCEHLVRLTLRIEVEKRFLHAEVVARLDRETGLLEHLTLQRLEQLLSAMSAAARQREQTVVLAADEEDLSLFEAADHRVRTRTKPEIRSLDQPLIPDHGEARNFSVFLSCGHAVLLLYEIAHGP